jgi:hypothetical protein
VKDLYDDLPDADVLKSRINAKLAESTDFVTIKVLQEDGLINSFILLRAETILPNMQHLTDGETGVELEASGKHVVGKRILDGSPAFFSFVLATVQRNDQSSISLSLSLSQTVSLLSLSLSRLFHQLPKNYLLLLPPLLFFSFKKDARRLHLF